MFSQAVSERSHVRAKYQQLHVHVCSGLHRKKLSNRNHQKQSNVIDTKHTANKCRFNYPEAPLNDTARYSNFATI
ncbi:hypothetical protein DPMN_079539 [Dreissena polymorpha]|uniref:Uncharacterized protein n=1 Tax=Dreissena polymorpha TaxID=45954 RepID=A0A9D3YSD6_DREPO|nr:hypothetical protein DPMN_079539 [Dreissena polymorpha]